MTRSNSHFLNFLALFLKDYSLTSKHFIALFQNTMQSSNIKKKIIVNYPKSAALGFFSQGLKNEFETAEVNKPSVFEPLEFYCTSVQE